MLSVGVTDEALSLINDVVIYQWCSYRSQDTLATKSRDDMIWHFLRKSLSDTTTGLCRVDMHFSSIVL